jgi:hypothetical protein
MMVWPSIAAGATGKADGAMATDIRTTTRTAAVEMT